MNIQFIKQLDGNTTNYLLIGVGYRAGKKCLNPAGWQWIRGYKCKGIWRARNGSAFLDLLKKTNSTFKVNKVT